MKAKNPLYVVKSDHVEAAENVFDLIMKKLNLEPALDFFISLFNMLLDSVNSYAGFMVIKNIFDELMKRVELFRKFAII